MSTKPQQTLVAEEAQDELRPAEKILNFINEIAARGESGMENRLPSIRQIARQLNVSVPTVQSVFHKLTREGKIRTEIGNGSFLSSVPSGKNGIKIALNFSMHQHPYMEDWMMYISMGILRAVSASGKDISLAPVQEDDINDARAAENIIARRKNVDGLILFPCNHSARIREAYLEEKKPVIDVTQPFANTTSNFVSPDYYSASYTLGRTLRNAGRRNALLILAQTTQESVPMRSIHAGFVNGFGAGCSSDIKLEVLEGVGHFEETGKKIIQERLKNKMALPDAIYSSNDYLALGAAKAFIDAEFKIPADVSIAGGTGLGLANTALPGLTRTAQPMEQMGAELLNMMCRRLEKKGEDLPGIFLPVTFTGTATVRKNEFESLMNFIL